MSVKIIKGDLIKSLEKGELDCYAHQCNCFNRMGRGIAPLLAKAVFGLRQADNKTIEGDENKLGTFTYATHSNGSRVYNIYGQYHWSKFKVAPNRNTDYDALRKGLECVRYDMILKQSKTLGLPLIGCGLAGGDWDGVVYPMIKDIFEDSSIDVTIFVLE